MGRPAVVTPTPTPEPKKPPQAGDTEDFILNEGGNETNQEPKTPSGSAPDGEPNFPVSGPKVNLEAATFLAFQKALSQAVARNQIRLSEATRIVEDKNIWANLWLGYQMMTGYAEVDPTKLAEGITYYTDAYVVPALQVMPQTGIDPKNWSKSLGKAMDVIRDWIDSGARDETGADTPYQEARNASLGYATAQQAPAQDKQAYLELLSTLNRQGYVDVYNALDQGFPAIYARWKALESDFPGLTQNDFSTYLNRYIAPAVGEVDPTQSATEFLKGMRRNLENLERLDTGRELIPEEGYRVDEDTGEVVPVSKEALKAALAGKTLGPSNQLTKAEVYAKKGWVPSKPGIGVQDDDGDWWINPDVEREKERLKTEAEMGRAGATAEARAVKQMEEAGLKAARQSAIEAQAKYAQEERIAAQVAPYTGTVSPETSAREAFNIGRRNLGLLEALSGGGRAAYERELEAERVKNVGQRPPSEPQPAPGYETRVQPLPPREPWTARRLAEPLAQQFPDLWEQYQGPRVYGWEKGPQSVNVSQFTPEEPFDMPFKDFLQRRMERVAASPAWAQPPQEGETRAPIANWGFKQPWEGGPAPRGFSQPRPTAGPARMTPIRIGARR